MSGELHGRVCLVTGATGGMGQAISTELARRGATVVLLARTPAGGAAARNLIVAATGNPRVEMLTADLADRRDRLVPRKLKRASTGCLRERSGWR